MFLSQPKILIIEDHPATLDAIRMIFEFEGYITMNLSSTMDLHTKVAAFQPDYFNRYFVGYERWKGDMYGTKTIGTWFHSYRAHGITKWYSQ
ncbi:response regulator [Pedobacter sp. R-06]|uniref:response regulator n=1 Tax=Pedobacter sp. R-06 TaxID=3404051 RepID=UPI003CF29962